MLYEKNHVYYLEKDPFPNLFERKSVMLTLSGTAILYQTEDYSKHAVFHWSQGYGKENYVVEHIQRYNLVQYGETRFFFGELYGNIEIIWWDNGDEFRIEYPSEIGVAPEDVIDRLRVVRYDL